MRRFLIAALLLTGGCLKGTEPTPVASVSVSTDASPNGVFVGDQVQFTTVALDISGNPVPIAVTYTSSNTAVATVTTSGLVSILSAGTTIITIASGSQSVPVPIVVDPNVSSSVQITPGLLNIAVGAQGSLSAVVITTLNHPARNKTLVWSTTDASKVTVDQTGKVTGVAATGAVSVCAAASDAPTVKGCATVIVQ
ncbi:MAG TPA: Ig-like domain-containing protein [Gemmatimonadaceae bacterium]|nr:Ig-like domain-containing protein [Gemmatimonadaceae bacterium]